MAIAKAIKDREQENAKARMVEAHAGPAKFAEQDMGESRDKAADKRSDARFRRESRLCLQRAQLP